MKEAVEWGLLIALVCFLVLHVIQSRKLAAAPGYPPGELAICPGVVTVTAEPDPDLATGALSVVTCSVRWRRQ